MDIPISFDYQRGLSIYRDYSRRVSTWKETPNGQRFVGIIFSLLTISLLGFLAIRPAFSTIASLKKQIADAQETTGKLNEKIQALSQARANYLQAQPFLPLINHSLPQKPLLEDLVTDIESAASISAVISDKLDFAGIGLKEATIAAKNSAGSQPPSKIKPKEYKEIGVSGQISGSWEKILDFTTALSSLPRLLSVFSLSFSPEGRSDSVSSDVLNLQFSGKSFYFSGLAPSAVSQ